MTVKRHRVKPRPLGDDASRRAALMVSELVSSWPRHGWECPHEGVPSNRPAREGMKHCAYLTITLSQPTKVKAPEIKEGRGTKSHLPILHSQTPGYTALLLQSLVSERCSYRPARWSDWLWTCRRQAQTLGSRCQHQLPLSYGGEKSRGRGVERKFSCFYVAMVKPS